MIALVVVLALIAGIAIGYAAKQRQDLIDRETRAKALWTENQDLWVKNDNLLAENQTLREVAAHHESNLEMLLREVEGSS
jgi:uncharacterized protein HemX